MSKKAGAQTGPGLLPTETSPATYQVPAAAQGRMKLFDLVGFIETIVVKIEMSLMKDMYLNMHLEPPKNLRFENIH